jgi:hypothetical protein
VDLGAKSAMDLGAKLDVTNYFLKYYYLLEFSVIIYE